VGALDWARLILREDGRGNQNSGASDHLGEPWATPLEEARLSSFLAADKNNSADELMPAFLSGEMIDLQSRLNFRNLVKLNRTGAEAKPEISATDVATFTRLFSLLNLPAAELTAAASNLLRTTERALNDPSPRLAAAAPALCAAALAGPERATLACAATPCDGAARAHPAQPQHRQRRGAERQHAGAGPGTGAAGGERPRA
jgi:hypothetical protein